MTVPGPIFILGVPVVVAVGLQFLRRWTAVTAWLGAVTAGLIGAGVVFLPLTQPWQLGSLEIELGEPLLILGRKLSVQPVDRFALAFLFFTTAGLFVVAWRLLPHSNFFPIGLVTVSLLAGALLVEQVVYTALLVVMAAVLAVFPLHEPETMSGRAGTEEHGDGSRTSGGLRYMAYAVLALPGLSILRHSLRSCAVPELALQCGDERLASRGDFHFHGQLGDGVVHAPVLFAVLRLVGEASRFWPAPYGIGLADDDNGWVVGRFTAKSRPPGGLCDAGG